MSQTSGLKSDRRAIIVVIDGCGVGAAPDAAAFGDGAECNTMANVARAVGGLKLPNMERLGLGNIAAIDGVRQKSDASGFYGKLKELSAGKDTLTGHWEMMGVVSRQAFPLYPEGFPAEIIDRFIAETGCKQIYSNKPASGTQVLDEFGKEHQKTGYPIVYTSGDSVFQIACHTSTVPLETLYKWCQIARQIMQGKDRVGRIIARPFTGEPGAYKRVSGERRDFGVHPPAPTLLDLVLQAGSGVLGIGKIEDIFDRQGLSHALHTGSNKEGLDLTVKAVREKFDLPGHTIIDSAPNAVQVIFTNLVDTDALWGHRRNVPGYAQSLAEIDAGIGEIIESMRKDDLLVISSDHGNDPTAPGTDHTREFVPLLAYSKSLEGAFKAKRDIETREGFVDMAASLASWLGAKWDGPGVSFIPQLSTVA
jgi:phosphopentomutase